MPNTTAPLAETHQGAVAGVLVSTPHGAVDAFLGIPYGLLGPGRSRFEPARAPAPWPGTRDCSEAGPAVAQNPNPYQEQAPARPQDEVNGLNLNVWTPGADSGRRATIVWIHGGANITGSNADGLQDGARLAAFADAVVVSVNYRLGVFGFLWLDQSQHGCPIGNAAIHDLVAALEWVRREIAAFGGDPDNVTIAGQSAGAALVGTLLGVPAAAGLFHRAIMQSGTAERVATPADGAALTREIFRSLDLAEADGARIFDLPTAEILAAQADVVLAHQAEDVGLSIVFRPVIDGTLVPDVPLASVRGGMSDAVDLLIGTNLDEASLFLLFDPPASSPGGLAEALADEFRRDAGPGPSVDGFRGAVETDLGRPPSDTEALEAYLTDRSYRQPSNRLLDARAGAGGRTYSYIFTRPSPSMQGRLGACHGAELPFVFGTLDLAEAAFFSGPNPPSSLSERMMSSWAGFIWDGRPGPDRSWPAYQLPARTTRIWNEPPTVQGDPRRALREFWATALPDSALS